MAEKRILMVIAPKDFRDEEFFEPYEHFTSNQNWDVTVASTQTGEATGMMGKSWKVEQTLDNQSADQFDALVIAGGMGAPEYLWRNEKLLQLVRDFHNQGKVVSAICLSGAIPSIAGIANGKRCTVWECPESVAEFEKAGTQLVKEDVVVDGNIITAPGPHAATPFAKEIANQLQKVAAR